MRLSVQPVPDARRIDPGTDAVIIDVLRATSTLTVAFAHGAGRVTPVATPEEALALRASRPGALACGERGGRIVPGFDLGNSPAEYTRERVAGKALIFASTNGSAAMVAARRARRRWLGAFVNASAIVRALARADHVTFVCSGKLGRPALEDLACAGWLCTALEARGAVLEDAGARLARTLAPADAGTVRALVSACPHARDLAALGPAAVADLAFCGAVDSVDLAFELSAAAPGRS
jgi:2-phosphosulfolactate phosphatase